MVTVIDTGLDETKFSAEFLRDFMRINQTPNNGEGRFGIGSFQKGVTKPDNRYATHLHGTQVADIVAGGSGLRSEYSQLSALIAINVVNLIIPESPTRFVIREGDIVNGVSFARDKGAHVANISVGSAKELKTLVDVLVGRPLVLVVAAGNERKDLGKFALYPGLYGGVHPQVITVAAHDRQDRVAEFSNYSGKYADLTAPGCAVPYSIQADAEPAHGTSFAAPLVSMTVALMRAFFIANTNIKYRLQAAIDYRPQLADRILWSGKLNIPKALSLYEDVLERKPKGSPLVFGKWVHPDRIIQPCQDGEYFDVHSIVKISTLHSEAPYRIRFLQKDAAGALAPHVCTPQSDWKGLNFEDLERPGSTELVPWSDLTDYVRAHFEDALGGEASSGPALSAGAPSGTFVQAPPQRLGSAK